MNKFTSHSMLNEVKWLRQPPEFNREFFCEAADGWLDLQLVPASTPVTLERATERRRYLTSEYFARLRQSDVVVLTLGLDEVWRDTRTGLFLNAAPPIKAARADPGRYVLDVTTAAENVEALEALRTELLCLRDGVRIIVTVSPVPLDVTFGGEDAVMANTRSKAVLVAAAAEFAGAHDDVDYFPSYDTVMATPPDTAFAGDGRHVVDSVVARIIVNFLAAHDLPTEHPVPGFSEIAYVAANPDVDEAVRRGEIESGFHHWRKFGQAEGRPITPPGGPTRLMVKQGLA